MDETQRTECIRKDVTALANETGLTVTEAWDKLVKIMPEIKKYRPKDI